MDGKIMAPNCGTVHAQNQMIDNGDPLELGEAGEMLMRRKYFNGSWGERVTLGMAYYAGIVEGKRQERARRKREGAS